MGETIYVDKLSMGGAFGVILGRDIQVVFTGLEVITENHDAMIAEISRLCGMDIFTTGYAPEVRLYSVPYLEVFASDGRNGWFAMTQDGSKGPVYHIGPDLSARLVMEYFRGFLDLAVSDPDWRRKHLPGGPWPRLPDDRPGRKKLAALFELPASPPEDIFTPDTLPRIFSSRAEAEKAFSIQDIWTVLRRNKTPRFQVHPMMSPADREGRALVHCQAWQETYPGLMPEGVLARHTLERCRKIAEKGGSDTNFVLLDRENGDRVVGFATISYRARDFVSIPEAGEIIALYVLKEYQGLHLGKRLMESCLARLPRPRTALFVLKGNDKAIGFYEHMGFRLTGHEITQNGMTELEMALEREAT